MTPDEQAACSTDADAICAEWSEYSARRCVARVYEQPESEHGPAEWVIEIRVGKPAERVLMLSTDAWMAMRAQGETDAWAQLVHLELESDAQGRNTGTVMR